MHYLHCQLADRHLLPTFAPTLGVSFNGLRLYPLNLMQLVLPKGKVMTTIPVVFLFRVR